MATRAGYFALPVLFLILTQTACLELMGPIPEGTPFSADSTFPADGKTGVPTETGLAVFFNQPADPSSLNESTFSLSCPPLGAVSGVVSYRPSLSAATFRPRKVLPANATCKATLTNGAKSANAQPLSSSVEWTFTTGATPDTTPPRVSTTDPVDETTGVSRDTLVKVTFSEPMDPDSIDNETFTLMRGTTPVSGTVTWLGLAATFTPAARLASGVLYTATIKTSAKDLAGNHLVSDFVWSFKTKSSGGGGGGGAPADTTPPTVIETEPSDGDEGVALAASIVVGFSESMDPATLDTTTFVVMDDKDAAVPGTVTYDDDTDTATFDPDAALDPTTTYTVTITTGAEDLAGNGLTEDAVFTFSTTGDV
jgi:hypothetical protein